MRRNLLLLGLFGLSAVGCEYDGYYYGRSSTNEIVFGISQDVAGGKGVSADYEFIGLGGHGGSTAAAFRDGDGDGSCWFENLADRLGKPHVDSGFVKWSGGTLGPSLGDGLLVQANQPEPTKQPTAGWTSADAISFYVEGFAMPPMDRVTMRAPLVELTLGAIAPAPDAANAMAITPSTDVSVAWTPPAEETLSRVLVTLETPTANVRCFDKAAAGSATIPAKWIGQLFGESATIAGTMTIATHRQTTIIAQGGWVVYVVAASVQRDIAFTGAR